MKDLLLEDFAGFEIKNLIAIIGGEGIQRRSDGDDEENEGNGGT